MAGVEEILAAIEAADDAAGFTNDQPASGEIPGGESGFEECVQSAGGDVTEIECCRTDKTCVYGRSSRRSGSLMGSIRSCALTSSSTATALAV